MLKKKLVDIRPSDKWWNIAQNRFDYQKNYIICKLLEKYHDDDFVLIIEYHDDFIIIDSKDNPKNIDFFQIKTSQANNWTSSKLSNKSKTKKNSIFWKMFLNITNFNNYVKSSNFISNKAFNVILKKKKDTSVVEKFRISDLWGKCRINFENSVKNEFKDDLNKYDDIFNFEKINLDIDNHEDLTIANIVNFIEKNFDTDYRAKLIHDHLFKEIRLKSKKENTESSFEDIICKRWITKADLEDIFKILDLDKKEKENIKTIKEIIIHNKFDYNIIYKYDDNIRKIKTEKINKNNKTFFLKVKQINKLIDNIDKKLALVDIINNIYEEFIKIPKNYDELNNESYIKTLIIYEYFKNLN